ncbi:MAG: PfkB family carbohydrate kinase [Bacillota bacterium]|nr:PfkB family carbohydrate kinase [Bacillota bacterium]
MELNKQFRKKTRALCIGGMNIDILGSTDCTFTPGDSLTGIIEVTPGGVAHNIAAQLAKTGAKVELLCPLGNDAFKDRLAMACQKDGIGLTYALQTRFPTPAYLAVHDNTGDMVAAINDMRAMDALDQDAVLRQIGQINEGQFDVGILDANLREDSLIAAASTLPFPLIADPVSAVKCYRLLPLLPRLFAIKPNRMEALAMTGEDTVEKAAAVLIKSGVAQVFVSLGKDGLYARDLNDSLYLEAPAMPKVSLTGAGDAMTAGLAMGIAQGLSLKDTAQAGILAASTYLTQKL